MINKLINLFALGAVAIWTAIMGSMGVLFFWVSPNMAAWVIRTYGRGCCFLLAIKVQVEGLENLNGMSQGAVLAPNHASIFDIPVVASLPVNAKWIAKMEVAKIPFIGQAGKALGMYFVKRDRSGHDLHVMREVEEGIRKGVSVVIFPEGTRTRTGELLPFKKGAFRTAQNTGAPLVPIAVIGTWAIAPPGQLSTTRGHLVTLRIGAPMHIPAGVPIEPFATEFRQRLIALLQKT